MAEYQSKFIKIIYTPRWKKFNPPLWWCFRWAYKISEYEEYSEVFPLSKTSKGNIHIKQTQRGGNNSNQVQVGIVNNYLEDSGITKINFPCKLKYLIDVVFSHNELVMIWYEDPENHHYSKLWWKGHAHQLPTEILESEFIKIKGIVQEKITDSDYISIEVRRKD